MMLSRNVRPSTGCLACRSSTCCFRTGDRRHEAAHVTLDACRDDFERFDDLMRRSLEQGQIDEAAIIRALLPERRLPAAAEWVIAGWAIMSIKGLQRYYARHNRHENASPRASARW